MAGKRAPDPFLLRGRKAVSGKKLEVHEFVKTFGTYESANTPIGLLNGQIFGILKMFDHPVAYDVIT